MCIRTSTQKWHIELPFKCFVWWFPVVLSRLCRCRPTVVDVASVNVDVCMAVSACGRKSNVNRVGVGVRACVCQYEWNSIPVNRLTDYWFAIYLLLLRHVWLPYPAKPAPTINAQNHAAHITEPNTNWQLNFAVVINIIWNLIAVHASVHVCEDCALRCQRENWCWR